MSDAKIETAALRDRDGEVIVENGSHVDDLSSASHFTRSERSAVRAWARASSPSGQNAVLGNQRIEDQAASALVGGSKVLDELRRSIRRAARTVETVLIAGETGTGKELVAREIHYSSARRAAPFVAVNCAAIPDTLLEAEFFGVAKGAFTGADRDNPGFFEATGTGSLFLDEIRDLPKPVQAKLLRVLQEREFTPVGAVRPKPFLGRILTATNADLKSAVEDGSFRRDLYYRLHVIPILVPPLRDHREDISALVRHFVVKYNRRNRTSFGTLNEQAIRRLTRGTWPGNVRELENLVTRILVAADDDGGNNIIVPREIEDEVDQLSPTEARIILNSLEKHRWNRHAAAAELRMSRTTLWRKTTKYNLCPRMTGPTTTQPGRAE